MHRLNDLGAVVTSVTHETSEQGFEAEWRGIASHDRRRLDRGLEIFDEEDLDAAMARFDELSRPVPRLENVASQLTERFLGHFAAGDWDAMAEILADDYSSDDRRRVVGAGVRHGRDAQIVDMGAIADVWITKATSTVIATRGERLVLIHVRRTDRDEGPEAFLTEVLVVGEINGNERIVASVAFDVEDLGAAFEELDARYLAGEAAAYAHAWSVIAEAYAAFNQHELPATDWATVDRRRATPFESSTMTETLRAMWDLTPDLTIRIEAVHELNSFGAVVTHTARGTSPEGFDAEWRAVDILTVDGDRITSCEVFDEEDLAAAVARFDELHAQTRRPQNAATEVDQQYWTRFAARDWDAMAELLADDGVTEDRRRVVNSGVRHGRDDHIAEMRAVAEIGTENVAVTVMATRGARLALTHICASNQGNDAGEFSAEVFNIVEIDARNLISARIEFDIDNIDGAFAELDARYLAGEAAAHSHTWSVIMQTCAAIDRREMFATTIDFVDIDHRSLAAIGSGDLTPYIRAALNDGVYSMYNESVHRLSDLGAVVTLVARGTSQRGFEAEWRMTDIFTVEGDLISRCELFDDADLDAALACFDELARPASP